MGFLFANRQAQAAVAFEALGPAAPAAGPDDDARSAIPPYYQWLGGGRDCRQLSTAGAKSFGSKVRELLRNQYVRFILRPDAAPFLDP